MYKKLTCEIKGVSPLMLNNNDRVDPSDRITKEKRRITSKRVKTESDQLLIKRLDWLGSLYTTKDGEFTIVGDDLKLGDFGNVCIRGHMLEACLVSGAKKNKLGVQFKAGVFCDGDFDLDFPEKKPVAQLYDVPKYCDTRPVKLNGKTTIIATRAIFPEWTLKFSIHFLPDLVNQSQIEQALEVAGYEKSLGTYRPKFGRFDVASIKNGAG